MHKLLLFLLPLIFLYTDCTHNKSSKEKRRNLMEQAIAALKSNDTIQLFKILDTTQCFKVFGKELVMEKINYTNIRFKECNATFPDSIIERRIYNLPIMEYILPYCRDSLGVPVSTSFDLIFRFADYENDNKIIGIDVEKYLIKVGSPKLPPPKLPG